MTFRCSEVTFEGSVSGLFGAAGGLQRGQKSVI